MKKIFAILLVGLSIGLFSSCAKEESYDRQDLLITPENTHEYNVILPNQTPDKTNDTANEKIAEPPTLESEVDVDLIEMSSTMVYAHVYDLLVNLPDYVGQTIRAKGAYNAVDYQISPEDETQVLNFIYVVDAAACCEQGLEFLLPEGVKYPEIGEEIEAVGTIQMLQEVRGDQVFNYFSIDVSEYKIIE